ncbi:MAG TPA: hypothetical protein VIW07_13170, partial [Candidatus Udaeobacter sp.]
FLFAVEFIDEALVCVCASAHKEVLAVQPAISRIVGSNDFTIFVYPNHEHDYNQIRTSRRRVTVSG